jgi:hypothetical protein
VKGSLRGDARCTRQSYGSPYHVVSPSPVASSRGKRGGVSTEGGEVILIEFVCRVCRCKGGDGGSSSVIDRGRDSALRDGRRRDTTEVGVSMSAAARTALRGGTLHRRRLELPPAVHTNMSSSATSLVTPSAGGAMS